MSTSYHPQADGQSERTNRTLEDILRAFVPSRQTNWDQFLAAAEFAINNSWHQAISNTPFFVNSGRHPTTPAQLATFQQGFTTNAAVEDIIQNIHAAIREVSRHTQKAQAKQKSQADKDCPGPGQPRRPSIQVHLRAEAHRWPGGATAAYTTPLQPASNALPNSVDSFLCVTYSHRRALLQHTASINALLLQGGRLWTASRDATIKRCGQGGAGQGAR